MGLDWEVGAKGGVDFWAAADAFVAQKRRGETAQSLYWMNHGEPRPQIN